MSEPGETAGGAAEREGASEAPAKPVVDGSREGVAMAMIIALVGLLIASPYSGWTAWAIMGATIALALLSAWYVQRSMQKRLAKKAKAKP
ncbi:MAG: hypothetical protein AAGI34_18125 [Pseudomonadota bacterium]